MDTFSKNQRSEVMRKVRSHGTKPEQIIRKLMRQMGIKYRTCVRHLPGKPDLVVASERKAILVHGCFWHGHRCEAGKLPKSNRTYWKNKQRKNSSRDARNAKQLRSVGWKAMTIWECEIWNSKRLKGRLSRFLTTQL